MAPSARKAGVAGAFVLAIVLGALLTAADGAGSASGGDSATRVAVPAGRLGDRVEYQVESPGGTGAPEAGYWFEVTAKVAALDTTGIAHDGVAVDVVTGAAGRAERSRDVVDLDTRDVLERIGLWQVRDPDPFEPLPPVTGLFRSVTGTWFGPHCGGPGDWRFRHQGESYQLGAAVTDGAGQLVRACLDALGNASQWGPVTWLQYRQDVPARTLWRDQVALGVHSEVLARFAPAGAGAPLESVEWRYEATAWVTADQPYPVQYDVMRSVARGGGEETDRAVYRLVSYREGASPIPWGGCPVGDHVRTANREAARGTGPERYPVMGPQSRLKYPITEAVASVLQDPSLANFTLWRMAHPGFFLVGAHYVHHEDDDLAGRAGRLGIPEATWWLTFADRSGASHYVAAYKTLAGRANLEGEDEEWPAELMIIASDVPAHLVPWDEAERLWSLWAPPELAREGPNRGTWGLWWGPTENQRSDVPFTAEEQFWQISIERQAPDTDPQAADPGYLRVNNLTVAKVDSRTGNLVFASERVHDWGPLARPPELGLTGAPEPLEAFAQSNSATALGPIAWAAGSLLGASMLFWFFRDLLKAVVGKGLALVPAFSKIKAPDVLKNNVRREIYEAVQSDPGIDLSGIGRSVDAGWSTVVYHVRVLERNGFLSSVRDGRYRRFFSKAAANAQAKREMVLRNERTRQLFALLSREPAMGQRGLAERTGLSVPGVLWHLQRLQGSGLIRRDRDGREFRYFVT